MPAFSSHSKVYEITGLFPTGSNALGKLSSSEIG